MSEFLNQSRREMLALPAILGKLLGGVMTVAGFAIAAAISSRHGATETAAIAPYLLMGIIGIVIFIIAGRAINKRLPAPRPGASTPSASSSMNILSWGLLLLFAGLLALFSLLLAH